MFKRIFLFLGVNLLILLMVSFILNLLGVTPYLSANGINYSSLMIFCLIWGMVGSFISLSISKWMAKTMMGVEIVSATGRYSQIVSTVHRLARKSGITTMPEVGIYQSPDVNAFATGPSKNNALVALSTGLINSMNADEIEGVIGHEVAHIANGDMVTMALLQGVLNAFVMFFARIAAFFVSQAMRGDNEREGQGLSGLSHILVVWFFEFVFGILASILAAAFSRHREYRADAGSADLAGKEKMIAALKGLMRNYPTLPATSNSMNSMQISSRSRLGILLSTHPNLEDRIKALGR